MNRAIAFHLIKVQPNEGAKVARKRTSLVRLGIVLEGSCTQEVVSGGQSIMAGSSEDIRGLHLGRMIAAIVAGEVLRIAVQTVGMGNLSGRVVRYALRSSRDFETGLFLAEGS